MKTNHKVLFIANHRGFSNFNAPYMHWFKTQGWKVDNASPGIEGGEVDCHYDVDIQRSPLSLKNFASYKRLKEIIDTNEYDIIHVHTPMGAVLGRLASLKARKKGTKVIYTAHGFHFYKGAPLKNWILFFPIEKILARVTDALVTINEEDYKRAKKHRLSNGEIYHIDGVGVNLNRFHPYDQEKRREIREKLGLSVEDFVGLYIAQVIPRKNHKMILLAISEILKDTPNFKMLFAGSGESFEECISLSEKLGISDAVKFLGPRADIPDLAGISDIHISSSIQEGLAIGNIEAMASGCPLVVSDIRGHREVCIDGRNGFLFPLDNIKKLVSSVNTLAKDKTLYNKMSTNNLNDVKKFSVEHEVERMAKIYNSLIDN